MVRGVRAVRGRARRSLLDCRSRRATRGPHQPRREERLGKPWFGSSPSTREHWRGEIASEAGARRQSRAIGGGLRQPERVVGALGDGRRSGPGKPLALTRERWKRFWFLEDGSGRKLGANVGARQGASEVRYVGLVHGPTHRDADGGPHKGLPRTGSSTHVGRDRRARDAGTEVGRAPSSARSSGVGLPQGGSAPVALGSEAGLLVSLRVAGQRGASREARESSDLSGCSLREVGCRSRREASSTQPRGEPRGEPRASRGSKARRLHP